MTPSGALQKQVQKTADYQALPRQGLRPERELGPDGQRPSVGNSPAGGQQWASRRQGPSRRQGGRWARPNESFHPSHARTLSQGPEDAGPEMTGRAARRATFSVSPALGEGKGQSVTTTLLPPRAGPSSSTHGIGGREGASERAPRLRRRRPALRPPPCASIGYWRRSHVGRRHVLHWPLSGRRD